MINKGKINAEELKIQGLLDRYLHFRSANSSLNGIENHLDEDSLTAFIEGRTSERESPSIIKHLINCPFCLHVTGELTKLNAAFAEDECALSVRASEPTKISDVLNELLTRIFGANDGTVFSHQQQEEDKKSPKDAPEKPS